MCHTLPFALLYIHRSSDFHIPTTKFSFFISKRHKTQYAELCKHHVLPGSAGGHLGSNIHPHTTTLMPPFLVYQFRGRLPLRVTSGQLFEIHGAGSWILARDPMLLLLSLLWLFGRRSTGHGSCQSSKSWVPELICTLGKSPSAFICDM